MWPPSQGLPFLTFCTLGVITAPLTVDTLPRGYGEASLLLVPRRGDWRGQAHAHIRVLACSEQSALAMRRRTELFNGEPRGGWVSEGKPEFSGGPRRLLRALGFCGPRLRGLRN